jgi:hypothetical protein
MILAGGLWAIWRLRPSAKTAVLLRDPLFLSAAALTAWLGLTALWSPASAWRSFAHGWHYALALLVPVLAHALAPEIARSMLKRFVHASGFAGALLVGWLMLSGALGTPPWDAAGWPVVGVGPTGNGLIVLSLLLALGAGLGLHQTLQAAGWNRERWMVAASTLASTAGLLVQDRRSGLVVLPLLLAVALLSSAGSQASARTRTRMFLFVSLLTIGVVIAIASSDRLAHRFGDIVRDVASYAPQGNVETSVGMRLRMIQVTADLVSERPLTGHGIGSWELLWPQRADGEALLRAHNTPHNEYLLVAAQGGLPALLLFCLWIGAGSRMAYRSGIAGAPALMVWTTLAVSAMFNATLRDARLALPLLLLAAATYAAARPRPS